MRRDDNKMGRFIKYKEIIKKEIYKMVTRCALKFSRGTERIGKEERKKRE